MKFSLVRHCRPLHFNQACVKVLKRYLTTHSSFIPRPKKKNLESNSTTENLVSLERRKKKQFEFHLTPDSTETHLFTVAKAGAFILTLKLTYI